MASMDATSRRVGSVRILIVDDFGPWRQKVCLILEPQKKLQVVGEASDGLEAVQKGKDLKPDLILLDIGLPGLNGIEAVDRICEVAPAPKILFLSQNNQADVVRAALRTGAQGYVLKTDAGSELVSAIEAVLRGDQFVSSGLSGEDFLDATEA